MLQQVLSNTSKTLKYNNSNIKFKHFTNYILPNLTSYNKKQIHSNSLFNISTNTNYINKTSSNITSFKNPFLSLNSLSKLKFCTQTTINASNPSTDPNADTSTKEEQDLKTIKNMDPTKIRNIAIIAHVDHGKTTLVDCLLSQSGVNITGSERAMDSNELEQERGITILSKCTSISYKGYKINIVDTPGHQDFGGEVERIMSMVDAVCLVVCASEGPMPQTRYVLKKALAQGLKPVVVINKADRDTARLIEVENEIFDLFINLEAGEEQMDYPLLYASAKNGWATLEAPSNNKVDMSGNNILPLLDTIISKVESPKVDLNGQMKMLVTQIESNQFFGKMLIGRITSGTIKVGQRVTAVDMDGKEVESAKVFKLIRRFGTGQIEISEAGAGDIVLVAGFTKATVTHTINEEGKSEVITVSKYKLYIIIF